MGEGLDLLRPTPKLNYHLASKITHLGECFELALLEGRVVLLPHLRVELTERPSVRKDFTLRQRGAAHSKVDHPPRGEGHVDLSVGEF